MESYYVCGDTHLADQRKDGVIELKFNEERTQALITIHPAGPGGKAVTAVQIVERLKAAGVTYGIREPAILEAVHLVDSSSRATTFMAAQGIIPKDGIDAVIHYRIPQDILSRKVPKNSFGLPDWFKLDEERFVKAEDELAAIVPPQHGIPGKTINPPVKIIQPKDGKPASLSAGAHVRYSDDALKLFAEQDGFLYLNGEQLSMYALRKSSIPVIGGSHSYPWGALFMEGVQDAILEINDFLAVRGVMKICRLRVHGDLFVQNAVGCEIAVTGSIYLYKTLHSCQIITCRRLVSDVGSAIIGGSIYAMETVEVDRIGSPTFAETEVFTGADSFSPVRVKEIEKELSACEENKKRIMLAIKPFTGHKVHAALGEEKRGLLEKLYLQQRTLENRVQFLHGEKRRLTVECRIASQDASITARVVAHPGVWIGIGKAAMQVETDTQEARFVEDQYRKTVVARRLPKAA